MRTRNYVKVQEKILRKEFARAEGHLGKIDISRLPEKLFAMTKTFSLHCLCMSWMGECIPHA
jgi:hypothetical protein